MAPPRLEPLRPTPRERGVPPALRDPVRLLTLAGGAALVVGCLMSWVEIWLPGYGFQEISSFAGFGDGAIALVLGIILLGATWADRLATSRIPGLVLLPAVLGIASLALIKLGWDEGQARIAGLAGSGGYGYFLPGFWLALVGAAVATVGGVVHVLRLRREISFRFQVTSRVLVVTGSGLVGAVVGIGAAVVLGEDFGSNATVAGSAVTFLSIVLGLVGAWLGSRIGRAFAGDTE